MNTYTIIRKKARGQENMVYLYLSYREKGSQKLELTSLKILIPKDYVIGNPNDVKKISQSLPKRYYNGFNSVNEINNYLQEALLKANSNLHPSIIRDKLFSNWAEKYIERILNQGTRMRYRNVITLLKEFSKDKKKRDFVLFEELDINYIKDFNNWLITERKNNSQTTQYKMKALKALINHSIKEKYSFPIHPFLNFKFKNNSPKSEILTIDELKILMKFDFKEVYRTAGKTGLPFENDKPRNKRYKPRFTLNEIRDCFIFQVLAQGLRLSDLLTLRWNNFLLRDKLLIINKKMIKTQKEIEIIVNDKAILILSKLLKIKGKDFTCYYSIQSQMMNKDLISINNEPVYYSREKNSFYFILNKETFKKMEKNLLNKKRPSPLNQAYVRKNLEKYWEVYNQQYKIFEKKEEKRIINETIIQIKRLLMEKEFSFVFPILKDKDFELIKKEEDFYTMNEDAYRKFQSGRTYYNKALKLIGQQAGIEKNFSSHVARHSYASLLLDMGENINLFDIMTSLGHSRLTTTQTYLKSLSNKKLINISNEISSKL